MERLAFNSCNLEFVTVAGDVHVVTKERSDGGTETSINGELTGVGSSGTPYVLNLQETITQTPSLALLSETRELLVSKGTAQNQLTESSFAFPPGEFHADVDCRG
jgi:hypothetical protein